MTTERCVCGKGYQVELTNGTPCCSCTLDRFEAIHGYRCMWDPRPTKETEKKR